MLGAAPDRRARRVMAALTLLTCTGLFAGCGGDSSGATPRPSPSASATASPTSSSQSGATQSPAPQPPAGGKDTAKARAAFTRFVVEAWSYALRTNDSSVVTGLSPKSPCKGCKDFTAELAQRKKQGWHVDFPGADIRKVSVAKAQASRTYLGRALVDIPASSSYFADGTFRNVNDAHRGADFDVLIRYDGGTYALLGFQVV